MKAEEEFEEYYQNVLRNKVVSIDKERVDKVKALTKRCFIYGLIPLPVFIALYIFIFNNIGNKDENQFVSFFLMPSFIFYIIYASVLIYTVQSKSKSYTADMKDIIIPEMLKFYDTNLQYNSASGIMDKTIEVSNLFYGWNDSQMGDYIEGKIGETFIQFSTCKLLISSQRTERTIFDGIFLVATFNKYFNGQHVVIPVNKNVSYFEIPGGKVIAPPEIKLEDPLFCSYFKTYGTDQVEARYIITPSMMQHMLDFRSEINDDVYFGFVRKHFFIAFQTNTGPFEPDTLSGLDEGQVKVWAKNIHTAISLVNEFNLNEHLWSKP